MATGQGWPFLNGIPLPVLLQLKGRQSLKTASASTPEAGRSLQGPGSGRLGE